MSVGNVRDSRSNALALNDIHCGDGLRLISETITQPFSAIYAYKNTLIQDTSGYKKILCKFASQINAVLF